jgi:hypothetical protein
MQKNPEDHDDISKLLRLKRFEQPSPEYFEGFLQEFKDRQRSQLLREPAWRIAWDRLVAFFGEQMPARLGYGLASTAVLVAAGIASMDILETRPVIVASAPEQQQQAPATEVASLNLNTQQVELPDLPSLDHRTAQTAGFTTPHYVLDTRPVSYVPASSF